ncbi:ImmA/IrrE family metallo-endopeptidase [bacterium]|nr:ImmA/IrrE family metallo-endopeptidase [bacterium]
MRAVDYARQLFEYIPMDNPPVRLTPILEKFNVSLYFDDFDEIDGITMKSAKLSIIVINKNLSITRQRFTIAHELGHIIMPHKSDFYVCYSKKTKNKLMERDANRFAGEILMPQPMIAELWGKYESNPRNRVEAIAKIMKISTSALRVRIRELGLK